MGKTRWQPGLWLTETFRPLLWNAFDRKQDLNINYQVCVFRADQKKKMASPASDWLRNFRFLPWNYQTEFNELGEKQRSQCPLPNLCFLDWSLNKNGRSVKKVAPCTQAHDMWPLGPLVFWVHGELIGAWNKQIAPRTASWFVCPALWFISHDPPPLPKKKYNLNFLNGFIDT